MARPRVLIVDDSPADAGMLRRFLSDEHASYEVTTAETGEQGLRIAAAFRPDVILLDFELPDLNGLEFLRELPSRMQGEQMPVVLAVTGQADPRVAAGLIRAGAEDYISKNDASSESLRLAVRHGTRTKHLRAALAERARERELSHGELVASLQRASFIASCSEALSKTLSITGVLSSVADLAVPYLCDACFVDLVENESLVRRFIRGFDVLKQIERSSEADRQLSVDAYEGSAKVLRTGTTAKYAKSWLPALARWDKSIEQAARLSDIEAVMVVPLVFNGAPLGALTLISERALDQYAQDVAGELGRRAAAAIANARAFEAETAAKRASEDARRRLSVLSQVSEIFTRSLEWRETMRDMVSIIVPAAADYASVALVSGTSVGVVASSTDDEHLRPAPMPENRPILSQTEYYPDVHLMRRYTGADHSLYAIGDREGGSFIRVPIISAVGKTIGDLVLSTVGNRRLSLDDLGLAEDLGRRIGMYIETATAFARERDIARSLQRSLLPSDIPPVPGVQFAARCIAGASGADVGGDWYDIIPLPRGYVAFAVGDVAGRGVLAAATMGQLRSSLRAYVLEGLGPGEALSRLNTFMLSQDGSQFATVALGVLHCASGKVRLASAGHLPPVLIDESGALVLTLPSALPVGVISDQGFAEHALVLEKGQSLAFFTDGLVESRSKDIDRGTEELVSRLGSTLQPDELLTRALDAVPEDPADDVTFLAVRYLGLGAEMIDGAIPRFLVTLPAVPQSAGLVRRHLETFCEKVGLHGSRCFDLQLAVGEAVANAIEHAYEGTHEAIFSVHARFENGAVVIDVLDQGKWREGVTQRGLLSERGRGVGLMRALCDQVRIERTIVGTRIKLSSNVTVGAAIG